MGYLSLALADSSCENPVWKESDFNQVYHVGPGYGYATPGDIPWESLTPGSLVKIHWRNEPYKNKWVINVAGSQNAPVVVLGVPENGQLPVISGNNATTRQALDYWNENRSLIKIGASSIPNNSNASHITIACLDLQSAKPGYFFTSDNGASAEYSENAAAIHIEQGEYITIENCDIHDAGNGLFSTSSTSNIIIRGNHIWDNGINGSIYEHNSYTESLGITFEFNHYGPLCNGCLGNNLKDRSAGTVIRYNWIEDGNRQLDLVDSDHSNLINSSLYSSTFVYGNILLEHEGQGNRQIVHYGGDSGDYSQYRKGTLYFYHNTVYSNRIKNTLMALSTNDESALVYNNIIYGADQAILDANGMVSMHNNWLSSGWVNSHSTLNGSINAAATIAGSEPGFINAANSNFHLKPGAPVIGHSTVLPVAAQNHPVQWELTPSWGKTVRISTNDLGAFDYNPAQIMIPVYLLMF